MNWLAGWLTATLVGIGSNLDNCGTGIAYGADNIRFPHWVNAVANVVGFVTALLGAYAGETISRYLSIRQAELASCIVLVCVGLFFWYAGYVHPIIFRMKRQTQIRKPGWKEGIFLGVALSFTNVASGFGATVANAATFWITAISIAVWGYLMLWVGNVVAIGILAKLLGKYSSFAAGLLLILVGLHQISA